MLKLSAKSAFEGLLPKQIGSVSIKEYAVDYLTLIDWPAGRKDDVSSELEKIHDITLPVPNRISGRTGNCCLWFGNHYLLMGRKPGPELANVARLTDVSDGYGILHAEGDEIEAVLARLIPINLCKSVFKRDHTAKTLVQHMQASVTRISESAFQIIVSRSMARTLVHDLERAMGSVAFRASLQIE
ncbi:MAG: sarcosine oxidase subunit gamma [Rhodobacteraceae bacterium]|nr:sarcosine oxidase subunit gamma [Paracoccaceae bacterium]